MAEAGVQFFSPPFAYYTEVTYSYCTTWRQYCRPSLCFYVIIILPYGRLCGMYASVSPSIVIISSVTWPVWCDRWGNCRR